VSGAARLRYATEPLRAALEGGALAAGLPLLRYAPRGDPHPVLVLPGLGASDVSTTVLRAWLRRLGYPVVGWDLGRNRGPTQAVVSALPRLLDRLAAEGSPVSVVGWSLGGIFARGLAARSPHQVRQVVTLGSPFAAREGTTDGSAGSRAYRRYAHLHVTERIRPPSTGSGRQALPVPSTSVYSREDGIVDWRACLQEVGPTSENVAVHGSHLGLGHNPAALWVVADRLAQPAGGWRPFRPPALPGAAALFPRPDAPPAGAGTARRGRSRPWTG
jgi:pimeloyl-ACP methyl ester carboxylesterase